MTLDELLATATCAVDALSPFAGSSTVGTDRCGGAERSLLEAGHEQEAQ